MADTGAFFEGLVGGITAGWANSLIQDRQEQLEKEKRQINMIGNLIAQGHYELYGALDPNLQKRMFGDKAEQVKSMFADLAGLENRRKKLEFEAGEERVRSSVITRQVAEEQLKATREEGPLRRRGLAADVETREATAKATPELLGAQVKTAKAGATTAEAEAEVAKDAARLKIDEARARITEIGQRQKINKLQLQRLQDAAGELAQLKEKDPNAWLGILVPEYTQDKIRQQQLQIGEKELERLDEIARVYHDPNTTEEARMALLSPALAQLETRKKQIISQGMQQIANVFSSSHPRDKENKELIPFENEASAKLFAQRVNTIQKRINESAPTEAREWRVERIPSGVFGLGGGKWQVNSYPIGEALGLEGEVGVATPITKVNESQERWEKQFGMGKNEGVPQREQTQITPQETTSVQPRRKPTTPAEIAVVPPSTREHPREAERRAKATKERVTLAKQRVQAENEFFQVFPDTKDERFFDLYVDLRTTGFSKERAKAEIERKR
jgi:hypothetical protein